ncbi:uncharacterized protein [Mycetomoellerius zeteki]|uniref:uncharacterized protein n=1 Tax=Mycetomoellerius zeteki TaxID=64791 RepID=UPI00084EA6BF|nr:PREDICTED: uncharacterized protein LOC108723475 [Trachymyrmex zeteki]
MILTRTIATRKRSRSSEIVHEHRVYLIHPFYRLPPKDIPAKCRAPSSRNVHESSTLHPEADPLRPIFFVFFVFFVTDVEATYEFEACEEHTRVYEIALDGQLFVRRQKRKKEKGEKSFRQCSVIVNI